MAAEQVAATERWQLSRGRGVLVWGMVGDALGAPFEGENQETVLADWWNEKQALAEGEEGEREGERQPAFNIFDGRQLSQVKLTAELIGLDLGPSRVGQYTDDSESQMALADSLLRMQGLCARHAALTAAWWWATPKPPHPSPDPASSPAAAPSPALEWTAGYSAWTFSKMRCLVQGLDYRSTSGLQLAATNSSLPSPSPSPSSTETTTGSWGNGAPMKIAPLGIAYRKVALRGFPPPSSLATPLPAAALPAAAGWGDSQADELHGLVTEALVSTHTHPEAIDAATVIARAVALLVELPEPGDCLPHNLLAILTATAHTEEMRSRLVHLAAVAMPDAQFPPAAITPESARADKEQLQLCLSPGKWFQIRAVDAVATVLYFFLKYGGLGWQQPKEMRTHSGLTVPEACLIRAVCNGGDTDTIASILGCLLGALYGDALIPDRWLRCLPASELFGLPRARALGEGLARLDCSSLVPDSDATALSSVTEMLAQLQSMPLPSRHDFQ